MGVRTGLDADFFWRGEIILWFEGTPSPITRTAACTIMDSKAKYHSVFDIRKAN
jgi:hypothetical protein